MINISETTFYDTKRIIDQTTGNMFDICNLGSSMGKFGFDYTGSFLSGVNLGSSPQSLFDDFKMLKQNRCFLKQNAFVIIPICPLSSICTPYPRVEHYYKYYPILPKNEIISYSPETDREIRNFIETHQLLTDPALEYDGTPLPKEMLDSANVLVGCWNKEFSLTGYSAPMTAENRHNFDLVTAELRAMLEYCLCEHLRPTLIIPPVSQYFHAIFTPEFRKHYIYDFLDSANEKNVPLLDYMDDPEFSSDSFFINSLMLNKSGRLKFTQRVLKDIEKIHMVKYDLQKEELQSYYRTLSYKNVQIPFNPLKEVMDKFDADNPSLPPVLLKAGQYEIIAEHFSPVLFPHDPFFYETGLKVSEYNGRRDLSSGGWLLIRNEHLYKDSSPEDFHRYFEASRLGLHLGYGPYCDYDHHCFPFSNILKYGLSGILERLRDGRKNHPCPDANFYDAAECGIFAVKKMAEKFSNAAKEKIAYAKSDKEKSNLERIEQTAAKMPWNPPETFYEGLACLRFFYELGSVLDGVGMSVVGAPDRMLISLYEQDLKKGILSEDEAYELICRYMLQIDCKLSLDSPVLDQFNAGEQGDTLILGGVDENGNDITNELTYMFLKAHRELKLIYPKIHCRLSRKTPEKLRLELARPFLERNNVISFLNDDVLICAQTLAGKSCHDAARYVAGGCWEVITEGAEHSEGANCYFSLGRVMDLSVHRDHAAELVLDQKFQYFDAALSFDDIYAVCMANTKEAVGRMLEAISKNGIVWPQVNPSPFFSACLDGCAESGLDYSAGGAKYSPHGVPFTGLAIYVDSLLAIKYLCFDKKFVSLQELLAAVRNNWENADHLRLLAHKSPHFGDGNGEAADLAARVLNELCDFVATFRNERGGDYQCGLYSYGDVIQWAQLTRATPDGRKNGDFLSQGMTPSRFRANDITSILHDAAQLPLERFPANSLMTLSISKNGFTEKLLADFLNAWCTLKAGGILQLNCITYEELESADRNPYEYADLTVP